MSSRTRGLRVQTGFKPASPSPLASPLSRSPSPSNSSHTNSERDEQEIAQTVARVTEEQSGVEAAIEGRELALGRLNDAVYAGLLPPWRDHVRKMLVRSLEREMHLLVRIQSLHKLHPLLSPYFLHTSLLGTHTFFMVCVPMPFWFGRADLGRGLLYVLAGGGYLTSVLKDLFCVPRPYSPPLVRLSVGNHALEYGFPSTHSCTTVSMALYFGELLHRSGSGNVVLNGLTYALLFLVAFSVVFGRLYTGMHSIMDITVGSVMGGIVWLLHWSMEDVIETYTVKLGWTTFSTIIPAILFLVFVHPAPAEDCPCFEDAVAFLSVVMGLVLGHNFHPVDYTGVTFGAQAPMSASLVSGSPLAKSVWAAAVLAKLLLGVLTIFVWRLVAKEICHAVLPPIFRFCSSLLLPRRHYLKATEYDTYKKTDGLHPIPSILDLPSLHDMDAPLAGEEMGAGTAWMRNGTGATTARGKGSGNQTRLTKVPLPYALRNRAGGEGSLDDDPLERVKNRPKDGAKTASASAIRARADEDQVKDKDQKMTGGVRGSTGEKDLSAITSDEMDTSEHNPDHDHVRRDADVLTKVFVYAGIGIMAEITVPAMFAAIGLSVPA